MATIYDLKPKFQDLLRPITRWLIIRRVTPNQITILALILSFLGGLAITLWPMDRWPFYMIPILLFVRMALNAIDGMLAREHNLKTKLGAILNEMGDVVSDSVLYLPFAFVSGFPTRLVVATVLLGVIGEMAGVLGPTMGASRRYDGPLGKSDRAFVFGLISLIVAAGVRPGLWLTVVFAAVSLLAFVSILNRCRKILEEIR